MNYNRDKSISYAHTWAYNRNPKYYNFDSIGGDCTSFISQCLYAGCNVMNFTAELGWYYINSNNRAPAWSGVEFLYKFLTSNKNSGPYAVEAPLSNAQPGDIIQLSFTPDAYAHSLFIVKTGIIPDEDNILVATHTFDTDNRPLNTYSYYSCRLLHIEGVRN